ncbi:RHS repeat-associated core domain-containing protein [Pseudomonas tohonis]|uniref:RHS repeat-associated core domain-containing protein n=1 Tax=Pseudomonas tohonis TaxID=2725477 RepID=UPI0022F0D742|nr:RHS repeat-associated core domain-containing protein [Pseudomonas tohonis]
MLSRIVTFAGASLFFIFSSNSFCAEWRVDNLKVYEGDYNSDGRPDIFLKAVDSISVGGVVNKAPFKSQVLLREGAGYQSIYNLDNRRLESTAWVAAPYHYYTADIDGDTRAELVLQPLETAGELLVVSPNESKDSVIFQTDGQALGIDISFNNGAIIDFVGKTLGGKLSVRVTHPQQGTIAKSLERSGMTSIAQGERAMKQAATVGDSPEAYTSLNLSLPAVSVGLDGNVQFSHALDVPAGINGMQPSLAVTYQGLGYNGILGRSWSMSGISAIHRCSSTIAQEGATIPVSLSATDKLCLDGNHLKLVSGQYLQPGSVYRGEMDGFSRVTQNGTAASPIFEVKTKNGETLTYGGGAASISTKGKVAEYIWGLKSRSDGFGNAVQYSYEPSSDSLVPTQVAYSDVIINFEYQPVSALRKYQGGGYSQLVKIASAINIAVGGVQKTRYQFSYSQAPDNALYMALSSVQMCRWGGGVKECEHPVSFEYLNQALQWMPGVQISQGSYVSRAIGQTFLPLDWDGDGAKEFARTYIATGNKWRIGLIKSNGVSISDQILYEGTQQPLSLGRFDYDGDGAEEILYLKIVASQANNPLKTIQWWAITKNGDIPVSETWQADGRGIIVKYSSGLLPISYIAGNPLDANEDGKDDLLLPVNGQWSIYLSGGTTQTPIFTKVNWLSGFALSQYRWLQPFARDPSGGIQVVTEKLGVLHSSVLKSGVVLNDSSLVSTGMNADRAVSADLNGDGLSDYLVQGSNNTLSVLLNTGSSPSGSMFQRIDTTYPSTEVLPLFKTRSAAADYPTRAFDYDGDGAQEILYPGQDALFYLLRYTGGSFEKIPTGVALSREFNSDIAKLEPYCRTSMSDFNRLIADNRARGNYEAAEALELLLYSGMAISCGYNPEGVKIDPFEVFPADYTGKGTDEIMLGLPDLLHDVTGKPFFYGVKWRLHGQVRNFPSLLSKVSYGSGNTVEIQYDKLTNASIHTPASAVAFPDMAVRSGQPVVSKLLAANGVGGSSVQEIKYSGARLNRLGRGFLGFSSIEAKDVARGRTSVRTLRQDFPFIGAVAKEEVSQGAQLISRVNNTWNKIETVSGRSYFPYLESQVQEQFEGGAVVVAVQSSQLVDSYGSQQSKTVRTAGSASGLSAPLHTKTVTRQFSNDEGAWLLGFATSETEQTTYAGQARSRTSKFTAAPGTLAVSSETRYSGVPSLEHTVSYARDTSGRVTSTTIVGGGLASRTTTESEFQGPWATKKQNALGHTERYSFDRSIGKPLAVTDVNGLVTAYEYDAFGRETSVSHPDGSIEQTTYSLCGSGAMCPVGAVMAVQKRTIGASGGQGKPEQWSYLDQFARTIRERHQGFSGQWIYTDNQFDALGRRSKKTEPYSLAPNYLTTTWDSFDRPLTQQVSGGALISYSYGAKAGGGTWRQYSLSYDAGGPQTRTERRESNALGQVELSQNAVGSSVESNVRYGYDADGNLIFTRVNNSAATDVTMVYDLAGNRIALQDPNSGTRIMSYDAAGQLKETTASDGSKIRQDYDLIGRMIRRADINPQGTTVDESVWTFDGDPNAIGLLSGVGKADQSFLQVFGYDSQARLIQRLTDIKAKGMSRTYSDSYAYDGFSRLAQITDASGLHLQYRYNGYGYATGETDLTTGVALRTFNSQNEMGGITKVTYGNGVVSDYTYTPGTDWLTSLQSSSAQGSIQSLTYSYGQNGVLTAREDSRGYKETFNYDALQRLLGSTRTLNGQALQGVYAYDSLGNVLQNPMNATLQYGQYSAAGQSACQGGGVAIPGPHAVLQSTSGFYCYDSRGNQISAPGRQIVYSLYDKPLKITSAEGVSEFEYDPERRRFFQQSANSSIFYLDEGQFEEVVEGGGRKQNRYIGNYLQYQKDVVTGVSRYIYQLRDQLGSIDTVTSESGGVLERTAYAPFGSLRGGNWSDTSASMQVSKRGFTGHEHLSVSNLIHMNGRLYDAGLGRFLSADIIYQGTKSAQSFNRYSYGFNSPFGGVDPTGYAFEEYSAGGSWFQRATHSMALGFFNIFAGNGPESWFEFSKGALKESFAGSAVLIPGFNTVSQAVNIFNPDLLRSTNLDQRVGGGIFQIGSLALGAASSSRMLVARGASQDITTLYRAVGPEEFHSAMNGKRFSFPPNGSEMKQFGFDLDEVLVFADFQTDYAAILRVDVSTSVLGKLSVSQGKIDPFIFRSGVLTLEGTEALKVFNSSIRSVEHAF